MKKYLLLCVALAFISTAYPQNLEEKVAYLFTYFTGNAPQEEQICYALSKDGYNFTPLNDGEPVIKSDTIAFTQCVRDPHLLRGEDGKTFSTYSLLHLTSILERLIRIRHLHQTILQSLCAVSQA